VGAGVGFTGVAVCANVGVVEVDTGACLIGGLDLAGLTIRYGNSTGIGWEADYVRSGAKLGASVGANAELLPILTGPSDLGRDDLCGGTATPQPKHFVGPLGMTGMSAKTEIGASASVDQDNLESDLAQTAFGKLTIESRWGRMVFDTSGACGQTKLGVGLEAGATAIAPGYVGKAPGFEPEATAAGPVSAGRDGATGEGRCLPPERPLEEALLTRVSFYFPRGSADLYAHVDNAMVVGELAMALLNESDARGAPTASRVVIAGHASPVWAGASDEDERLASNDALASARAEAAEAVLVGLYDGMGGSWPRLSVDRDSAAEDILEVLGAGSSEGDAATGDRCNDDGARQRVDLWIYVQRPAEG
jgi:outer membrane protein OmpA-like peptidoglycan-associated protein